jgi:hypothetical protein
MSFRVRLVTSTEVIIRFIRHRITLKRDAQMNLKLIGVIRQTVL